MPGRGAIYLLDGTRYLLASHVSRRDITRHECPRNEPDRTTILPQNQPDSHPFGPEPENRFPAVSYDVLRGDINGT
jgi:hypothetical protein